MSITLRTTRVVRASVSCRRQPKFPYAFPFSVPHGGLIPYLFHHCNPHLPHQEAGIHVLRHAFPQAIAEGQRVARDVGLEATVVYLAGEGVGQGAEGQVVRGDDAVGLQGHELADEGQRTFLLVGGVGALQDFVEDDEEAFALLELVDDEFQPLQFGKEVRLVVGQGVTGAQAGDEADGCQLHLGGTDGRTDAGQEVIDAYGAQVGALARHIGTGDDDEFRAPGHSEVVAHTAVGGH